MNFINVCIITYKDEIVMIKIKQNIHKIPTNFSKHEQWINKKFENHWIDNQSIIKKNFKG